MPDLGKSKKWVDNKEYFWIDEFDFYKNNLVPHACERCMVEPTCWIQRHGVHVAVVVAICVAGNIVCNNWV